MNIQSAKSPEIDASMEAIITNIDDDQTLGDFRFKGCQKLARDLIAIEAIPSNLITTRGVAFDQDLDMLLLENEAQSSRRRSFEFPGGKVFDGPDAYAGFSHYRIKQKVLSVLRNFLSEIEEETALALRESAYTYEGFSDAPFPDPPYYFKSDRTLKSTPLYNRTILWFSGVLPPLYRERIQPGNKVNSEGRKEDQHDGFEMVEAANYEYYSPLLHNNSLLPDSIRERMVPMAKEAIKGQVRRVLDGDFTDKTKLNITDPTRLGVNELKQLMASIPYYCPSKKLNNFDLSRVQSVSLKAITCVRNQWGVTIPEPVTQAFYNITNQHEFFRFLAGRPSIPGLVRSLNEAEKDAIRFIAVALAIYGTLAEKGFLREDLDEIADRCRDEYLRKFTFQGKKDRKSRAEKEAERKDKKTNKEVIDMGKTLEPITKDDKEKKNPLWANYDKYRFVGQDGQPRTVFVRRNAKTEDRIVNKYLSKPALNVGDDLKDLIGLRFVFPDKEGAKAFSDWIAKEQILKQLGMSEDIEAGTNVEGSARATKGEVKYIGTFEGLPCEVQIVPFELHEQDEKGLKHHRNYSGKQFMQGGLRIRNHHGFSPENVDSEVREIAKTTKTKIAEVWSDWKKSFFKAGDGQWYSFDTTITCMNISGISKNQDTILKYCFESLSSHCGFSGGQMTSADWFFVINDPSGFVRSAGNEMRSRQVLAGLKEIKSNRIKKGVVKELETYFELIDSQS